MAFVMLVSLCKNNIMKAMTKLIPIICLFVIIGGSLLYSCSQEKKKETAIVLPLEAALSQAGENRVELEKVLHRYQSNPSDSLKYRAACFLIENMPSYTFRLCRLCLSCVGNSLCHRFYASSWRWK